MDGWSIQAESTKLEAKPERRAYRHETRRGYQHRMRWLEYAGTIDAVRVDTSRINGAIRNTERTYQ